MVKFSFSKSMYLNYVLILCIVEPCTNYFQYILGTKYTFYCYILEESVSTTLKLFSSNVSCIEVRPLLVGFNSPQFKSRTRINRCQTWVARPAVAIVDILCPPPPDPPNLTDAYVTSPIIRFRVPIDIHLHSVEQKSPFNMCFIIAYILTIG